ncbi:PEGA domain-containing protein [Vulgatibacter incomptus]|uniref:TolA protein n=1 Tax=Vulgatibacter incomptus TaxID=1391653 RepID=A0A0K1PEI4_9BACT|nr:PEGA domain-containing protein [Vulgatibacter incomptus]AKU91912.1 TolA protein [Vulgatibacter incomptus]
MNPSRKFAPIAAAIAVAVSIAPAVAMADKVKVVVVPYAPLFDSIPRATGEQIAATLEDGLGANGGVKLVKLPKEAGGAGGGAKKATAEQTKAVEAARADLARGKELLASRKMKPALDAFTQAVSEMESNFIAVEDIDPLVDAYLKQAVALFRMGREGQAAQGPLVKAIRVQPSLRIAAGDEYDQVFVDLYEKVRGGLAAEGTGSLRVDTTPPGAGVWIDGREAATSPVLVAGLLPGVHYVKIKLPSTDPYVERVEIRKDELFRITPDDGSKKEGAVASLITKLTHNDLDADARAQVAAVAKQTGAQVVVIGGAYAKGANMGIVSFAFHVKEGTFSELQPVTLDRDMLGASIEINKVAKQIGDSLAAPGAATELPRAIAADAKAGAEKIHEVDFAVNLTPAAPKGDDRGGKGPIAPASGPRRPVGGQKTPAGGGGTAPEASAAPAAGPTAPAAAAPAPKEDFAFAPPAKPAAPAVVEKKPEVASQDFLLPTRGEDFGAPPPKVEEPQKKTYKFAGGASIEDETVFEQSQVTKSSGGLLSKWWFWTGAAAVAGGVAGLALASGGNSGATPHMSWR